MNINGSKKAKFKVLSQSTDLNELKDLKKNLSSNNYKELKLSKEIYATKSTTESNSNSKLHTDQNYKVAPSQESLNLFKNFSVLTFKNQVLPLIKNDNLPVLTTETHKLKVVKPINYKPYKLKDLIDCQKTLTKSVYLGPNYGDSKWHDQHENLTRRVSYEKDIKVKNSLYMNLKNHNYQEYLELKTKRVNKQNSNFHKSKFYSIIVRNRLVS